MSTMMMFKRGAISVVGLAALLGAAAPALADHSSGRTGSHVFTSNSDKTLNVADAASDSPALEADGCCRTYAQR
jgi:hypothetical protein